MVLSGIGVGPPALSNPRKGDPLLLVACAYTRDLISDKPKGGMDLD
jgi:hypothetical protein